MLDLNIWIYLLCAHFILQHYLSLILHLVYFEVVINTSHPNAVNSWLYKGSPADASNQEQFYSTLVRYLCSDQVLPTAWVREGGCRDNYDGLPTVDPGGASSSSLIYQLQISLHTSSLFNKCAGLTLLQQRTKQDVIHFNMCHWNNLSNDNVWKRRTLLCSASRIVLWYS